MPFRRIEFDVPLSETEVESRIQMVTRPRRTITEILKTGFRIFASGGPPFVGEVSTDSFQIRRDIRYRNSFLPLLKGRLTSVPGGTRVNVVMHIHPLVALFMLFWFSGVGAGAIAITFGQHSGEGAMALIPFGMLVFGVALVCGGFYPEANKAERLLRESLGEKG